MYQQFNIIHFETDLIKKTVTLICNFDIDRDTVSRRSVKLVDDENDSIVLTRVTVKKDTILLDVVDDLIPNHDYLLICSRDIKSVTGEHLYSSIIRNIRFVSTITDTVEILCPSRNEKVDAVYLEYESKGERFRVQIARENIFSNKVIDSIVDGVKQIDFDVPDGGQYYARVRVESDKSFGPWSEIVPFLYRVPAENEEDDPDPDPGSTPVDPDKPTILSSLELISLPEDGETPLEFVFIFDDPIDETKLTADMISVYRRDF